jgi:phospholipase C
VGEDGFDFTRFGVRVPAVLVSPLISAGTVFRGSGPIDHTSVLKTLQELFGVQPLTARDAAAASLGDVLTLATPRTDDPVAGVAAPASHVHHPSAASPSHLEMVHAMRVAALPIRNEKGFYDALTEPPDFDSAAQLTDFVRDRTAAWSQHVQRQKRRRADR